MYKTIFKKWSPYFARNVSPCDPIVLSLSPVKLAEPENMFAMVPLWVVTITIEDNSETNNPSCLGYHSPNNQPQQKQEKAPLSSTNC